MQPTRKQIHEHVYFIALILVAITLPLSVYITSIFMILLLVNWVTEGMFADKWKRVKQNRALQIFLLLYAVHILGLFWSSDLGYWLWDIKMKLPLFVLPIIIASAGPLTRQQLHRILFFFTVSVFVATVFSLFKLLGWLPGEIQDYRELSIFINHIRFALMIVLALLSVIYFLFLSGASISRSGRIFYLLCLLWFPVSLALLKSLSGLIVAGLIAFFFLLRLVFEIRDRAIRFMALVPVIMIPLFSILYLGSSVNKFYSFDPVVVEELDSCTIEGNAYTHLIQNRAVENGHYTWINVCDKELQREWEKVSSLNYRGRTSNGQSLRTTLIRFLTSKGQRKDAVGFKQLTEAEVRAIEQGTANYIYLERFKLYPRVYEVIWEIYRYRQGYNPNEKSVVQRYLYLEAGWQIAREHLWVGVGNGDVWKEFRGYYDAVQSPLDDQWRRKSHNQFLTFLISFGIPGLVICLLAMIAPLFLAGRQHSFMALGFLILILLSMLSEDTLETATGVSFMAYFYALFIFGPDFPWLHHQKSKGDG